MSVFCSQNRKLSGFEIAICSLTKNTPDWECFIYTRWICQSFFFDSVFVVSVLDVDFSDDDELSSDSDFDILRPPDGERLSVA